MSTTPSLRDLAEQAGARFTGAGLNLSSHCPLHGGDNPTAFHLYADGTRWHCFTRCPDGQNDGDLISFYMRWKNLDFKTALKDLDRHPSSPPDNSSLITHNYARIPIHPSPIPNPVWTKRAKAFLKYARLQLLHPTTGAPARAYLFSERGLKPITWEVFNLGYNPTDIFDNPASWGLASKGDPLADQRSAGRPIFLPRGLVIPGITNGIPRYIKIRRPLSNEPLAEYLPPSRLQFQKAKFLSVRGSHPAIFGADTWDEDSYTQLRCTQRRHDTLLLTEGEWDCMLAWQTARAYLDTATLGSASNRAAVPDLVALARYPRILAVYDDDPAGDQARRYLSVFNRVEIIPPPAHDLTDYFRQGGDLAGWLSRAVNEPETLKCNLN